MTSKNIDVKKELDKNSAVFYGSSAAEPGNNSRMSSHATAYMVAGGEIGTPGHPSGQLTQTQKIPEMPTHSTTGAKGPIPKPS